MNREISFRYILLRNGAYCAELQAREDQAPHLRMNDSGEIKMSFTGTFAPLALDADGQPIEPNWFADEIQPCIEIDGVLFPLGVFLPATPREADDGVSVSVRVEAYDRCWRVRDTTSESLLYWPAGTLYLTAVEQLLSAAGIETVFKTPSSAAFSETREDWDLGTSYLTVINQLLSEINYNPLWFNDQGAAVLEPANEPEAEAIKHTLDMSDPETRVPPGISRETDIYSAPNVWIVTCENPDKTDIMVATATNDNTQSPLSVTSRGRRICRRVSVNNIADQAALQDYADRLRNESMIMGETMQISTGLLPGWGVADVVGLVYSRVSYDAFGQRVEDMETAVCIERAYDMELKLGGRMTHTLERVVYNLA